MPRKSGRGPNEDIDIVVKLDEDNYLGMFNMSSFLIAPLACQRAFSLARIVKV